MNKAILEEYSKKYPLQIDRYFEGYDQCDIGHNPKIISSTQLTFTHPEIDPLEQAYLMYHQFNEYMKRRFGDTIAGLI